MNFKTAAAVFGASVWILPVYAAESVPVTTSISTGATTNVTTIAASKIISPGAYSVTIAPSLNIGMAERLEKVVGKVPGLESVSSHANDSSLHFKVKNGATVRVADIQKAIAKADAGAVMSEPILEHSLTANPGL